METGLKQKGYEIVRISDQKVFDGDYDMKDIKESFDAILRGTVSGGYSVQSSGVTPKVFASFTLVQKTDSETLFDGRYFFGEGNRGMDRYAQIIPDKKFSFESVDDLFSNPELASDGLKDGANKLAERILKDL